MDFSINLKLKPSPWFTGVLAELNELYSDWTDGSYDWAAQTTDFLHMTPPLPAFDDSVFETPLSRRAVNDLLHLAIAMIGGDYPLVRRYGEAVRFAFVIGYPRSGGSYLTKELLRVTGLDHTRVSEALAHDGFPELSDGWYGPGANGQPGFYLQESLFQAAEFLVIANLYYRRKTVRHPHGYWLAPKKFHKIVNWAGSFKMLLGPGRADYLVTIRNPLPTAISIYEKSGGFPEGGLFPAQAARSAIERWIVADLVMLGHSPEEIAAMDYFEAVQKSWSAFYARMATSGLFLGLREEIRLIPYGAEALEGVVREYNALHLKRDLPEEVLIHEKANAHPHWVGRAGEAVAAMTSLWASLGLTFPALTLA
ncbi:hypothetical protein [Acidocella sp.]|uniref:hypothetical protein n=1 Tax=Acidocella sp. TaxID=50710 RepID=UPI002631D182|nr:hypothetical protein [Acidocella sp.]